jgi:hypothetical protein
MELNERMVEELERFGEEEIIVHFTALSWYVYDGGKYEMFG